jgi:hypothetical protein
MRKESAMLAVSVLSLFMLFWYIQTESVSPFTSNGFGFQGDKVFRINTSEADFGETAQNNGMHISRTPLGNGTGNSDNSAGIRDKLNGTMGHTVAIPRGTPDTTGGGVKTEKTDNTNQKVRNKTRQRLNVTEEASTVGNANATKINSLETEPTPGDKHIIFIETGCLLNGYHGSEYLGLSLYKRQACAIESAAKMNPEYKVYLLYSCPVNGKLEDSSEHARQIFAYPNVRLWRLDLRRYFLKTPLEKWDFHAAMASSSWPIEHASDVLRFLTLWKYGGTYMDLDFVILK